MDQRYFQTNKEKQLMGVEQPFAICIPRIDNAVSRQYIFSTFCALKIGFIDKVLEFPNKMDGNYKRVVINVKWNKSELSEYIQTRFREDKNVKVVYDMPWYWICVANKQFRK